MQKAITEAQLEEALNDYNKAYDFTVNTHKSDMDRIDNLNGLMANFEDFFYEFTYVVIASGFRAKTAARLTPELVKCHGDMDKMLEIFSNKKKIESIKKVWDMRNDWSNLRKSFKTVDDLVRLPFIGPITKFHLARNIGLLSCAKPDLHLCKWVEKITGNNDEKTVSMVTQAIADKVGRKQGTVDFALWVWLSHNKGEETECCHGGYALR